MKYVAVTQAKDQQERLLSWFLYHHEQGFDTFIYYDDYSEDDTIKKINYIKEKYQINIIVRNTDGIGYKANIKETKNSNSYGGILSLNTRIIRSYNSATKMIREINSNAIVAYIDVDEYLVPEYNKKVINVLDENLFKFNNHIYVQSFDVQDTFSFDEELYIISQSTSKRWDYESRQNTIFNSRGKSIINLNNFTYMKELPNVVHTILDNGHEGVLPPNSSIDYNKLRIHHYRKPSLEPNIKLVEDYSVIDFAKQIKKKYGV